MRVVVVGATGNVGTSLLGSLRSEDSVDRIIGVARRRPSVEFPKVEWETADIISDDLDSLFKGADAVVHLAWAIQPSRDLEALTATNVTGSRRVFEAVERTGVPSLVYASSIGAYSPGPKDRRVAEDWPTNGINTSFYSRHKAEVERLLDDLESRSPSIRVVRLRKAIILKAGASCEIRRLFMGPLIPTTLIKPGRIPFVPHLKGIRTQLVHSHDVGEAYRLALLSDVRGPFNIAAEPVLDFKQIAGLLKAMALPVPKPLVRRAADLSWRLRLQPSPVGWYDMAALSPLMDTTRATTVLGWVPRHSSKEALLDFVYGLNRNEDLPTPPLARDAGGPFRIREFLTGIGAR
ncbi:MAG TPA: NAD-dependent epimerase/dehydratase family protein [Actinomycetota bacterium]|nr:NAD-dependent epimerase/dehydratase family protein [Actinomycetota bacterium]